MSEGMFVALLVAGFGFLILLGALAWGMLELRRQALDDDAVTDLTEEQAERRLDQIMRDLQR